MVLHSIVSPEVRLKKCIFACTNPRANRKAPVPPIIGITRIGWNIAFLRKIVRLLPLNFLVVKTRFLAKVGLLLVGQLNHIDHELNPQAWRWVQALLLMGHQKY